MFSYCTIALLVQSICTLRAAKRHIESTPSKTINKYLHKKEHQKLSKSMRVSVHSFAVGPLRCYLASFVYISPSRSRSTTAAAYNSLYQELWESFASAAQIDLKIKHKHFTYRTLGTHFDISSYAEITQIPSMLDWVHQNTSTTPKIALELGRAVHNKDAQEFHACLAVIPPRLSRTFVWDTFYVTTTITLRCLSALLHLSGTLISQSNISTGPVLTDVMKNKHHKSLGSIRLIFNFPPATDTFVTFIFASNCFLAQFTSLD